MEPRRSILIIAYDFPPIASAGMARIVSMVRALTTRGWDVTVLTVRDSFVRKSPENVEMVPADVVVVRTRSLELTRTAANLRARAAEAGGAVGAVLRGLSRLCGGVGRHAVWPDGKAGWFVPLLMAAARLIRRSSYDAVLSSSPPHSTHVPLLLLRAVRRFNWIVDFRDPWTTPSRKAGIDRLQRRLEGLVLGRADHVIANTPGNKNALLDTFPGLDADKITVLTNGFDTGLVPDTGDEGTHTLECDLVYTGHIYPRMLDPFIEALELLQDRGRALPTVWVYGVPPGHLRVPAALGDCIVFKDRVSFRESLAVMRAAPALLFLVPHGRGFETWVPSKLYPYLFSGRPVFALVPEGDAARIIEETATGTVVRTSRARDVADELERFLVDGGAAARRSGADDPRLSPYSWTTLGARLDALLRTGAAGA